MPDNQKTTIFSGFLGELGWCAGRIEKREAQIAFASNFKL
jgi:hypothetical protein